MLHLIFDTDMSHNTINCFRISPRLLSLICNVIFGKRKLRSDQLLKQKYNLIKAKQMRNSMNIITYISHNIMIYLWLFKK